MSNPTESESYAQLRQQRDDFRQSALHYAAEVDVRSRERDQWRQRAEAAEARLSTAADAAHHRACSCGDRPAHEAEDGSDFTEVVLAEVAEARLTGDEGADTQHVAHVPPDPGEASLEQLEAALEHYAEQLRHLRVAVTRKGYAVARGEQ